MNVELSLLLSLGLFEDLNTFLADIFAVFVLYMVWSMLTFNGSISRTSEPNLVFSLKLWRSTVKFGYPWLLPKKTTGMKRVKRCIFDSCILDIQFPLHWIPWHQQKALKSVSSFSRMKK